MEDGRTQLDAGRCSLYLLHDADQGGSAGGGGVLGGGAAFGWAPWLLEGLGLRAPPKPPPLSPPFLLAQGSRGRVPSDDELRYPPPPPIPNSPSVLPGPFG